VNEVVLLTDICSVYCTGMSVGKTYTAKL